MCGRLILTASPEELAEMFGLGELEPKPRPRRYNVAPTQMIPVVRVANGKRELADLRWGFIPSWSADPPSTGFVNARAETASTKPAFRNAFRTRRCLVPANGFFEWKHVGKQKYPYLIRSAGGGLFAYAGLWEPWTGPDGPIETVAILTVPANDLVRPLHDRMPAILPEERFTEWLDPCESSPARLLPLLVPYPIEKMESWPVSDRVNGVAADDPALIEPIAPPPRAARVQPTLFDID